MRVKLTEGDPLMVNFIFIKFTIKLKLGVSSGLHCLISFCCNFSKTFRHSRSLF